ncbi:alpha-D-xyloside xylohydrolase [Anaerocolumna jejuensis DSM 15929]|uniref:Alpha-D-xyloside xylohydrolase n=1 Tax=Anaerocolumna jejuensis DSM 15929 TaxID=1121322 RepID=A0A1M6XG22_9FIRM|nr:glycoside hydrolase family 31 protein [Anaerocolumna jejuensis]SHL04871.1 alpha-D-xyloside xylohydrolase [Anaerocolumna jejuensis DSM 15929]
MFFNQKDRALICRQQNETLKIEPWGKNSLRVRSTLYPDFSSNNWALSDIAAAGNSDISIREEEAAIQNGSIRARVNAAGVITFYKDNEIILREYYRNYSGTESRESSCLKVTSREFAPIIGGDYSLNLRFESNDKEKIYGMGQYQHAYMNQKGCILELAQRNSQISIPFAISNLGYGFLWNNPAVGKVTFGNNYTEWHAEMTDQMDYWITADDSPAQIVKNYTEVTGRAPMIPENVLGLWQCKLRYRTQEEVLEVARKYKELGIPLDVIVIDFFHWTRQGDWCFDPEYWPDPKAMVDELHSMGTRVMVSVWPSVDRKSTNFEEMYAKGLLIRTERGTIQTYDFNGDCVSFDAMNPEARSFVWEKCRENYYKFGIDMFWLDNAEPDYAVYDFDNYRYYLGPALKVSNIYPLMYSKAFYDGLKAEKEPGIVNLVRSAWAGSQKYAALVWSGDVRSTFESFRDQLMGGLNIGLTGIPWWTTDVGGFMGGDVNDPEFIQLLIRWFQFAVFSPVLRMHGDREPHNITPLSDKDHGGGYLFTGQSNEMWSYGDEAFEIMNENLKIRLSLKPYILDLMKEASETGAPLMRTMFYEFPQDEKCWEISDQYMFGTEYLVAPVLYANQYSRNVYLPDGLWKNLNDGKEYKGGQTITCDAPIEYIPVFKKC